MALFKLRNGEEITVDREQLAGLAGEAWNVDSHGVVARSYWDREAKRSRTERLSIRVTGERAPQGWVWIHADGDWRNFRRENLVPAERGKHHARAFGAMSRDDLVAAQRKGAETRRGQPQTRATRPNALKLCGVHKAGKKFRAVATVNGKQTYLGLYATKEDAARAYDAALVSQGLRPVNFP